MGSCIYLSGHSWLFATTRDRPDFFNHQTLFFVVHKAEYMEDYAWDVYN